MSWKTFVNEKKLEIASVMLSDLNEETRLDAEYYRPEALSYLDYLEEKKSVPISSVAKFVVGPFGSTVTVDKYVDEEIYSYIRNQDIKNFVVNKPEAHISKELFEKLKQFHIQEDDLFVTVVGTLGKVAIVRKKDTNSIFSCKSTLIRCTDIDPYYLTAYMNSRVGQTLLLRCKRGAIQEGLNLFDIKTLKVAIPSKQFQEKLRIQIKSYFDLFEKSASMNTEAEQLLLKELNLGEFKSDARNFSIRNLKDCNIANRIDAEFWQEKYNRLLINLNRNSKRLGEMCRVLKGKTMEYVENGKYKVIKTKQLKNSFIDIENCEDSTNKGITIADKDVLFASMGVGSLGKTDIFYSEFYKEDYVTDSTLFILRDALLNPECLLTILRSEPYQNLIYRYIVGSSGIISISMADFENLPIPVINTETQRKISTLVKESHQHYQNGKNLLERVKSAIEIFIERDEEEAIKYIDSDEEQEFKKVVAKEYV